MAETRTPVTPVRIDYVCEECGEEVAPTGEMHPTIQPIYIYSCPLGHIFKSQKRYPRIEYVLGTQTERFEGVL